MAQQYPGGVSTNLTLWLRADAASTLTSSDRLDSWTYFNNPANAFTGIGASRPVVQNSTFNFLPSVFFNGAQVMDGPTGANAPITAGNPAYSIFAVWSSTVVSGVNPQWVWVQQSTTNSSGDGGGLFILNGQYGDLNDIPPGSQGIGLTENINTVYISQINVLAQNTLDLELIDQTNIATSPLTLNSDPSALALTDRNISTMVNKLGTGVAAENWPFNGNLAELIVYNQSVGVPDGRNKIFSYLAMKYGVNLGLPLLSSAGATVWDATAHSTYNNNVFGLALDNASGLAVNTANSSGSGVGNGSGVSGQGNIVVSSTSPLTIDQSFLMIGNDNNTLTESPSNLPASAVGSSRLARNWFVQNTNFNGPVGLSFDLTGLTVSGTIGTTTDFRLIVNDASDPTYASGNTAFYTPNNFTGNVANFYNVTLPNASVFAVITNATPATPLPVKFLSFTAQASGNDVDLNWSVGVNQQAKSYVVDHSIDGTNFTKVGEVANDVAEANYHFVHAHAGTGKHYYRILETDMDGKYVYSTIASAMINSGDFSVAVLNNPASGNTDAQLQINAVSTGTALIELWTASGSRISVQQQGIGTGMNTVSVPMSHLPAGNYVVKVLTGNATRVVQVVKL